MFTDPIKNLKAFGLREDSIVADFGAGTGFYSVAAGHIVTNGKVYAIEIVKDFLETIKNKIKETHLNNVEVLWGDVEKLGGTKIKDNIVDAAIVSNILSQVIDKEQLILEVKRVLKQKGKVLLVDWSEPSVLGAKNVISKDKAREMFEKKGFLWQRDISPSEHHYGIILLKS